MYYKGEQKLGITEFTQVFYENLNTFIITNEVHLNQNKMFYDDAVFKMFDIYQRSNIDSIKDIVNLFEVFLWAMFKNKPSVEKNDDEILVNN